MANLEIQLRLSDINISEVEAIWGKLKQLQQDEPKIEITNFNFME